MGYRYYTQQQQDSAKYFLAVEITGTLLPGLDRKTAFKQIMLLHNDLETLLFAKHNMAQIVNNSIMMKKMDNSPECSTGRCATIAVGKDSLVESIIIRPEKNVLHSLKASLKKAILSIALDRYNFDKDKICKVLGLSSSQLDDEMRSFGFALLASKGK